MGIMNKKLLILGGTTISLQILYAAKSIGISVYVTDYNEDSPCKKYADKSFMVSATDIESVVELIKEENIDGVLMGYADVLLPYYVEICQRAGLPCYANSKAVEITTDKDLLKRYCIDYNIPVVEEFSLKAVMDNKVSFPLIVKPVDNSGARGIYICHNRKEFEHNYLNALCYSKSGKVLIERLMQGKEATIFYYFHEGKAYLLGIGDRWMYEQNADLLKLPIGYTFPSKKIEFFLSEQDQNLKRMFHSLNMNEGMVFIQTFLDGDKYIVYEMGYRLTGSIEHYLMEAQYGFNHLKAIINFAVGNKVEIKSINPENCCMANVSLLLKEGIIERYEGINTLNDMPGVVNYHISYPIGQVVDCNIIGKLAQVGIRVLLVADNESQLLERMDIVKERLHIWSTQGEEMIINDYSYQTICQ